MIFWRLFFPLFFFIFFVGIFGFKEPTKYLDLGNSGTGARLILGAIMGSNILVNIKGDNSLSKRPMARILNPIKLMGAKIISSNDNKLPITIKGPKECHNGVKKQTSNPSTKNKFSPTRWKH